MIAHHAVLVFGSSLAASGYDVALLAPDTEIELSQFDTCTIGDVRVLIERAFLKPVTATTKTMVVEARGIAPEAQQALLKILEEPPLTTKFVFVLPSAAGLLPTLLSRVSRPQQFLQATGVVSPLYTMFLKSSYAARLECVARITKDKDIHHIDAIKEGVILYLSKNTKAPDTGMLLDCIEQLSKRGAAKKMLLEEIALTLPLVAS